MKFKTVLVLCTVFVKIKSECENSECVEDDLKKINEKIAKDEPIEHIDLKVNVPGFKQVKNVEVDDLNNILLQLTSLLQDKINESAAFYQHVNNKTKIFVKTFDFDVDFEKGSANIDVELAGEMLKIPESGDNNTVNYEFSTDSYNVSKSNNLELPTTVSDTIDFDTNSSVNYEQPTGNNNVSENYEFTTTTPTNANDKTISEFPDNIAELPHDINEKNGTNIDAIIEKLGGEVKNDIYNTIDFDTTYYDNNEDNSTDYPVVDYLEMYKDTTNEERVYTGTELPTTEAVTAFEEYNETEEAVTDNFLRNDASDPVCQDDFSCQDFAHSVFPWVATIFIKNDSENSQFNYYCDGVLVSEKVIITGGRCVDILNETVAPENVLVFLGKGNLNTMGEQEKLHSVKQVILHQNFSVDGKGLIVNDLAVLVLEDAAIFSDIIQAACINYNGTTEVQATATTAWGPSGQLLPIFFEKEKSEFCYDKNEDIFCTTYGNSVPLCPNYGGLYAVKSSSRWCLQGMFYGDPAERGLCFEKNVLFTSLNRYFSWIFQVIEANKV